MKKNVILVEIIGKSIKIEAKWWNYLKNKFLQKKMKMEISPFVKLKFGPLAIVCWSKQDGFWVAIMKISLMAILFSSTDDCRWPKIQFKKPEKMFFVSREFSRFVNFTFLQHFVTILIIFVVFRMIFSFVWSYFCFLMLFWLSILFQQINRWFSAKNWIIKKT